MLLRAIAEAALADVDPARLVATALANDSRATELLQRHPLVVGSVGKAALRMADGVAATAVRRLIVAPSGCGDDVMTAAHPVPDQRSVAAGQMMIRLVSSVPADGVMLMLVSGGASSLMEMPAVPLVDFVDVIARVMARGAPIADINACRQGLSLIKGGRLARMCAAPIVTVVVSDVIGDDLRIVGSGPTIGDADEAMQRENARAVLARWLAGDEIPASVTAWLAQAVEPSVAHDGSRDVALLAAPMSALRSAAAKRARTAGYATVELDELLHDDVAIVAKRLLAAARVPGILVAAGEPTIDLPAMPGRGGRAQQLALLIAEKIAGDATMSALILGSDGRDGPGDDAPAGALVDGKTWAAIIQAGIDPRAALDRADAGPALVSVGALVHTGDTGRNHGDLMLIARA